MRCANVELQRHDGARPVPKLGPVLSKNTNELKTGAPGRFDRVVSKNTNEL